MIVGEGYAAESSRWGNPMTVGDSASQWLYIISVGLSTWAGSHIAGEWGGFLAFMISGLLPEIQRQITIPNTAWWGTACDR